MNGSGWQYGLLGMALCACALSVPLRVGEAGEAVQAAKPREALNEQALNRAEALYEHGDIGGALAIRVALARRAPDEDVREGAREQLREMGLSSQEIFTLDPAKLKDEKGGKLLKRLAAVRRHKRRLELEQDYAERLTRLALALRLDGAGRVRVELRGRDLARAVQKWIQLALDKNAGDVAEEAQQMLERIGLAGAKIEATRKALKKGKLPEKMEREVGAAVCLLRLKEYRAWMREAREAAGEAPGDPQEEFDRRIRVRLAPVFGVGLLKYLEQHYAAAANFKRNAGLLDFWRQEAKGAPGAGEKF